MNKPVRAQGGFTLIEAIIAMVITGIVAGIVSVFMAMPINAYLDSTRRADLTDAADLALRRIGYEVRSALPNSVRVDVSPQLLEFVPTRDGGRYRLLGPGNPLDNTIVDTSFDVLGSPVSGSAGDFLVVANTGQVGLDVYAGANRRVLSAVAGATVSFANASAFPPADSPGQRFQIVPATGPVAFVCSGVGLSGGNGTGVLRRQTNYGFNAPQVVPAGVGDLLAEFVSACQFDYAPVNAVNGLLTARLQLTREGETVTLLHQLHVDNAP